MRKESSMKKMNDLSLLRRQRSSEILRFILANGAMTRSEIVACTGYTMASVIKYTQFLVESGVLMQEPGGSGRTLSFRIATGLGNVVAIVVGRTIQAILVNPHGVELCSSDKIPFESDISPEAFLAVIDQVIGQVKQRHASSKGGDMRAIAIGLAIGGYINPRKGISHSFYASKTWQEFKITDAIGSAYGIHTFMMNDANAAVLGEKYYGDGKAFENMLLLWLGEGTGLGLLLQGELYTGASFYAGEIGHTKTELSDELCYCGKNGCLETVTSESNLIRSFRNMIGSVVNSGGIIHHQDGAEDVTIQTLINLANQGDRFAQKVFTYAAKALAAKLADICNVLNPEALLFRGPIIDGNRFLFDAVEHELRPLLLSPIDSALTLSYNTGSASPIGKGLSAAALLQILGDTTPESEGSGL
ncbi:ROK family protein [Sediminispirochaeta smaragdinae DSM 11293]|uniref:ROK family protein n=2 Tax=Sediminispirochaeta TaxID=1911556 RepID=E1RBZ0_SEDSS|nr:ROK family protein [Sediminispirochaeta smaragdinae DSM 11293]